MAEDIWEERALYLKEILGGTGIDISTPTRTLLDQMTAKQNEHPDIEQFLYSLPGYHPANRNLDIAEKQLSYVQNAVDFSHSAQ